MLGPQRTFRFGTVTIPPTEEVGVKVPAASEGRLSVGDSVDVGFRVCPVASEGGWGVCGTVEVGLRVCIVGLAVGILVLPGVCIGKRDDIGLKSLIAITIIKKRRKKANEIPSAFIKMSLFGFVGVDLFTRDTSRIR